MKKNKIIHRRKIRYPSLRYIARQSDGTASFWIESVEWIVKHYPKTKFLLVTRVSSKQQQANGNLNRQGKRLLAAMKEYTGNIVNPNEILAQVYPKGISDNMIELIKLIALETKSIPVTYCVNRFVRSPNFDAIRNPDALPTNEDFIDFRAKMLPLPVATLLDPDMPTNEILKNISNYESKYQIKEWTDFETGYRKRRKKAMQPKVIELRDSGLSINEIAKLMQLSDMTILKWLK